MSVTHHLSLLGGDLRQVFCEYSKVNRVQLPTDQAMDELHGFANERSCFLCGLKPHGYYMYQGFLDKNLV